MSVGRSFLQLMEVDQKMLFWLYWQIGIQMLEYI